MITFVGQCHKHPRVIIQLSQDDRDRIADLTLLRLDKVFIRVMAIVSGIYVFVVLLIPYYGWKQTPKNPPTNLEEHLVRVAPYAIIVIVFWMIPFLN